MEVSILTSCKFPLCTNQSNRLSPEFILIIKDVDGNMWHGIPSCHGFILNNKVKKDLFKRWQKLYDIVLCFDNLAIQVTDNQNNYLIRLIRQR